MTPININIIDLTALTLSIENNILTEYSWIMTQIFNIDTELT